MRTFGDACFLACSWTWCIGLWLPFYLIQDFGWIGWAAFAIPNVIGAAGMGLVLRAPGASEAFVERHGPVMSLFSVATVLFHVSFLSWFGSWVATAALDRPDWRGPAAALILLAGAAAISGLGRPAPDVEGDAALDLRPAFWRAFAIVTLVGSTIFLALAAVFSGGNQFQIPRAPLVGAAADAAWVFPALAFGFGLCPALDLTLHRVRRSAPGRRGDLAFVAGFGVIFLSLITASGLYAAGALASWMSLYLAGHIALQSVFTMSAHLRELRERPRAGAGSGRLGAAMLIVLALVAAAGGLLTDQIPSRVQYHLILGAYALPFPAYLWIVGFAGRRRPRLAVGVLIVAVVAAAPAVWLGGVERRWPWLTGAVGIALLAGAAMRLAPSREAR